MTRNKIISLFLFTILGLIALQVPFTRLLGSNVKFTLFDFIAPTAGAFIGSLPGVISVLIMQITNLVLHGTNADLGGIIRLFPTLFAVVYFSKKRTINWIIPLLAIVAFNLNPIGRSAWQYSLFWIIPLVANLFHKNLFARSLGATFTAHAVGGAIWVWTFGLTKEIWLGLIPVVAVERLAMASGITLFYFVFSKVLNYAAKTKLFTIFPLPKKSP
ncbi:hypothetical protein HY407_02695 [Candidatus Gottesmanbacteria bacterium]|nr:hypothetical protein [Candidatus Gottesmanbacteria bacterium]